VPLKLAIVGGSEAMPACRKRWFLVNMALTMNYNFRVLDGTTKAWSTRRRTSAKENQAAV
jgi:hypothetical protein